LDFGRVIGIYRCRRVREWFESRLQGEGCTTSADPQNGGDDARNSCSIEFTGSISVKTIVLKEIILEVIVLKEIVLKEIVLKENEIVLKEIVLKVKVIFRFSTVIRSQGHLKQRESRYHNHEIMARRKLAWTREWNKVDLPSRA
jgi:hypothetical protein